MVKSPKSPPMFAAPGKVTEVDVNQSVPVREKLPVMVAADAAPQRLREIAVATAIRRFFFILESQGHDGIMLHLAGPVAKAIFWTTEIFPRFFANMVDARSLIARVSCC